MRSFLVDFLTVIFVAIAAIYIAMASYLFFFQRNILYVPDTHMASPQNYGLETAIEKRITAADGTELVTWFLSGDPQTQTLLIYYHGNAGNLGGRYNKLRAFNQTGMAVLALSYRGYGSSAGTPSEEGIYQDARAAIEYGKSLGFEIENIVIYGESLGSGVAVQMATEYDVRAIALEAPYTSIAARGKERYPFIPIDLLLKDRFDSLSKIKSVTCPVLIFHGELDEVMPIHHGKRLLEAANLPKEGLFFADYGHTDFDLDMLANETIGFVQSHDKDTL